jgi:hypothetical protein
MKHAMKNVVLKFGLMGLLGVAAAGTPAELRAQNTNMVLPGLIKINKDRFPFQGRLKDIDSKAQTITLSNLTIIQITATTVITSRGKSATLAEGTQGDYVSGTFRKETDGKLNALDLHIAPRHVPEPSQSKTNSMNKATTP